MKIRQCFLELQLKMSGMFFFETHCSVFYVRLSVYVLTILKEKIIIIIIIRLSVGESQSQGLL